jgi:hypothetical protein
MLTFSELGRYGRLGNQMFQVASTIGIATKLGYKYGFPYWMNYDHKDRFGSTEDIDIQSYFKNPLPEAELAYYNKQFIHWGYHNLNIPDRQDITGHLQSEKYFAHCKDLIRHYFEFKSPYGIMPEESICMHVRRGDYDNGYHPFQYVEYYLMALQMIPDYFTMPIYIFSDDIVKCREMFGNRDFIYVEGNHYMDDLQLMTQCKHFILSNSTLCWWGWWLSKQNGKVIAPLNWFGPQAGLSSKDIYTDEMILI